MEVRLKMDERDSELQNDFSGPPELNQNQIQNQNQCTTSFQVGTSSSICGIPPLEDYYRMDKSYTPDMVLPRNFNNNLDGDPDTIVNRTFNSICSPALDTLDIIPNGTFNSICYPTPDMLFDVTFNSICHLAPDMLFDGTINSICDPAPNVASNGTFNSICNPASGMLLFGNSNTVYDYGEYKARCSFGDSLVSSGVQELNHEAGLNPGLASDEQISSIEGLQWHTILSNVPELNHNAGLNPEWTSDEQMALEEGLQKFAAEPSPMRYIRIAATMHHKTARDVALRYRWMVIERKKAQEYNARRKGNTPMKKGKMRKSCPNTNLTTNPPKLKEFSAMMTGEPATEALVPPYSPMMHAMDQSTFACDEAFDFSARNNFSGSDLQGYNQNGVNFYQNMDKIHQFSMTANDVTSVFDGSIDMQGVMGEMLRQPTVNVNGDLGIGQMVPQRPVIINGDLTTSQMASQPPVNNNGDLNMGQMAPQLPVYNIGDLDMGQMASQLPVYNIGDLDMGQMASQLPVNFNGVLANSIYSPILGKLGWL